MAEFQFTNKLLKEAIADAEQVRQTAIENAKLSLEETFTPQVKSMLSRRIRAEAEEEKNDDVEKDASNPASTNPLKYAKITTETSSTEEPKDDADAKELPHQDGTPVGSSAMPADTSTVGTADNKEPSADAFDSSNIDQGGEGAGDSENDWYDDWTESDFDLDEVIAELEADIKSLEGEDDEAEGEDHEADVKDPHTATPVGDDAVPEKSSEVGLNKDFGSKAESGEEEGEEGEEAAPAGLEAPVAKPITPGAPAVSVAAPSAPDADAVPGAVPGAEVVPGEEAGEELNIEAILKELEADEEEKLRSSEEMAKLQSELAEYRKAVSLLRGKLHEVNLLNAKLLYTNRIFKKDGLSNEQKISIVENFDRATTVREVKMVYTVLVETLTSAARLLKATKTGKKVVAEGFASNATRSTAPAKVESNILTENAKRLQQLAGILS